MEEITVVELEPQLVLGIRKRGPYEQIAILLPELCEFAVEKGAQFMGMPTFVCHEATPEESIKADAEGNADVEVAIPVATPIEGSGDIRSYELPGGKMAKIIHKGPYQECTPTYEKLFEWVEKNGKKIIGPIREIYLNDPNEVPPEEILTEIYAPID